MEARLTEDRRATFRRNAFTFGAALAGGSEIGCLVWDANETGAMIEVEEAHAVPDRFDLRLAEGAAPRPARVAWRDGRRIGVSFEA